MSSTTSNMGLTVPEVDDTDYPTSISDSMDLIDAHDHTSGKGVQIPTGGIADLAVTTAKLAAGAVTQAKRAALGQQISSSSSSPSGTTSGSFTDITNLSVSITTTGRPVFIGVVPDGSASAASITIVYSGVGASTGVQAYLQIVENGSAIAVSECTLTTASSTSQRALSIPVGSIWTIATPAAGTYTYKVQGQCAVGTGDFSISANYSKLVAYEL